MQKWRSVSDRLAIMDRRLAMIVSLFAGFISHVTAVAAMGSAELSCPTNCSCSVSGDTDLLVDCHGRAYVDVDLLTEQLDSLLSSNLTVGRLTSLNIVNTPLTHVPRSVCRLTTLTQLHLDYNRLTRLPDNCFTNLTALTLLSADRNVITQLQDGVFDGLRNLTTISIAYNQISSIGLRVFNSSAMLSNLRNVTLKKNKLTTLEPWAFVVGNNGRLAGMAKVNLDRNSIQNFTNEMGRRIQDDIGKVRLELWLTHNSIKHVSDILNGWNISLSTLFALRPVQRNKPLFKIYLADNQVDCDCEDYDVYKTVRHSAIKVALLNGVHCGTPDTLDDKPVISVPLDQFVCDVSKLCPPGCQCDRKPSTRTLRVDCSQSNLTDLPAELPELSKSYTKYELNCSNNPFIRHLEHRNYFVNTSILDVSNCNLTTVDNAWKALSGIETVSLSGNELTQFSRDVTAQNVSIKKLRLKNNPWDCSCKNEWMQDWLRTIKGAVGNQLLCQSPKRLRGKNIFEIPEEEFCTDPVTKERIRTATISASCIFGVIILLSAVIVVVYRLRVPMYTRWKFHPFDRDECLGEDMDYDVFLSCSSDDDGVGLRILQQLEDGGYRVCHHNRDFTPGRRIFDNIGGAIMLSKRTLCLLTSNFVRSGYCTLEFDAALDHWIQNKRITRLIVLMALDSPNELYASDASNTAALRQYLRQYTYIDYTADDWLDKLLYALPIRGMRETSQPSRDDDDALLMNVI